jgi:hypothetical protein
MPFPRYRRRPQIPSLPPAVQDHARSEARARRCLQLSYPAEIRRRHSGRSFHFDPRDCLAGELGRASLHPRRFRLQRRRDRREPNPATVESLRQATESACTRIFGREPEARVARSKKPAAAG